MILDNAPAARLVAITGRAEKEDRRHSIDAGFEHHLIKPLDLALVGGWTTYWRQMFVFPRS
jgi:CheY-like chemotaxis protein